MNSSSQICILLCPWMPNNVVLPAKFSILFCDINQAQSLINYAILEIATGVLKQA